ncbi:hypothetical protein ABH927_001608 [Planotetraspora sp. GP83]
MAALNVGNCFQNQTDKGAEVRVVFSVGVKTRI